MSLARPTRIITLLALVGLVAASCTSDPASSGSTGTTTADPRDERRDERREVREQEERREERREAHRQDELTALTPDLPLEAAVVGLDALPPDFPVGGTSVDPEFDETLTRHPTREDPVVCPRQRAITIGYSTLPSEDVAGVVVGSPTGDALLIHVVARLDAAGVLWNDFVRVVSSCTSSIPSSTDGVRTASVKLLPSIRAGRASGLGYRQIVTSTDAPTTLITRYFMRNGDCVSDLKVVAAASTPDGYVVAESVLRWAAEALNRVEGCTT